MRAVLALFFWVAATITQANAQLSDFPGKALFELCSRGGDNAAYLTCLMYIRGFLDGYSARQETICFPEGLTIGEAAAAFVRQWRTIEAKKGTLNMGPLAETSSAYVLTVLMKMSYPCKSSR